MGQWGFSKTESPAGGTEPKTVQQIFAAEWVNAKSGPILGGGKVTGRSDLSYAYEAGAGLVPTPDGAVKITWPAGVTALVGQPSVARTDAIFVDSQGLVRVVPEAQLPSAVCVLDRRRLPAGATATSASTSVHNKNYALPYGSSLGYLATWREPSWPEGTLVPHEWWQVCTLDFYVPTDRHVDLVVRQCIAGNTTKTGTIWDQLGMGSMQWAAEMDGQLMESFDLPYDMRWIANFGGIRAWKVAAGQHRITIRRRKSPTWGAIPVWFGGGPNRYVGTWVGLLDQGVAE